MYIIGHDSEAINRHYTHIEVEMNKRKAHAKLLNIACAYEKVVFSKGRAREATGVGKVLLSGNNIPEYGGTIGVG